MTIDERIAWAKKQRNEAYKKDSVQGIVYWDGYLDALKAVKGYLKASDVAREIADGIINEILPKHLHGHNEKALELSFAISNFITNHKEWGE